MQSSSNHLPSMSQMDFQQELVRLYGLCGSVLREQIASLLYEELGHFPAEYVRRAFKRVAENPPSKLNMAALKAAIRAAMPVSRGETVPGCEYCETGATIPYVKIINGRPYQYVARCHKCKQSTLKHLPWYNEEMPHDVLQPRPKERDNDGREEIKRMIKNVTRSEGRNMEKELYRQRILNGQREYEKDNSAVLI